MSFVIFEFAYGTCLSICLYLSRHLFICYCFLCLSAHTCICLSFHLDDLSIDPSIYQFGPSICFASFCLYKLSSDLSNCHLYLYLFICLCIDLDPFIYLSKVHLYHSISITYLCSYLIFVLLGHLSMYLSTYGSISRSAYLITCSSI